MSRIAYVNGRYVPHREATVHIEDRGYQFADGVYEVVAVVGGKFADMGPHLDRLDRSLKELRIAQPMSRKALEQVMAEVIRRNRIEMGIIYLQMTRAVAPRDHPFPAKAETQVVMTAKSIRPQPAKFGEEGVRVITTPDIRWQRCDIKSVSLLPNILAKQQAREAFITSATSFVLPVSQIDDKVVANGKPGSLSLRLCEAYSAFLGRVARGENPAPAGRAKVPA
jgi:D-alanine transaminase